MGMCGTQASQKLVETCSFYGGLGFVLPGKDAGCHGMGCTVTDALRNEQWREGSPSLMTAP